MNLDKKAYIMSKKNAADMIEAGEDIATYSQQLAEKLTLTDAKINKCFNKITNKLGAYGNFINQNNNLAQNAVVYDALAIACTNNEQTIIATDTYGSVYFEVDAVINHKYYLAAYVKATSSQVGIEFMDEPNFIAAMHSGSGKYEFLSIEYTKNISDTDVLAALFDSRSSNWTNASIKDMIVLDITDGLYTKSQLDAIVSDAIMTDGYFNELYLSIADKNSQQLADIANKIVYSTVLSTPSNAFTITTDSAGNALDIKSCQINIIVPAGCSAPTGSGAIFYARVNDIVTGYIDSQQALENAVQMFWGVARNVFAEITIDANILNNSAMSVQTQYYYSDGTTRSRSQQSSGLLSGINSINKIYFYMSGGFTLPAGTIIEIRGSKK